jgi:integrator complex subunit 11
MHCIPSFVLLVGYCVAGTVGNRVLSGAKKIDVDRHTTIDVNCKVSNLSFSAHADAKGIVRSATVAM